jgi:D-amino-acid dehydrogenase
MKVVVLGAGVVGTAAAYYLARDGHEVTVLDRNANAAEGTSYSNAGFVSPSDATAWGSPSALKNFIRSLTNPDLGIRVRFSLDPYYVSWIRRFLRECTEARMRANTDTKLRLAFYSLRCLNEIAAETGVAYDQRSRGILYLYRSQQALDGGAAHLQYLVDRGLRIEIVDRNRLREIEPGLAVDKLAGAIHSPMDQTGDSRMFTRNLAEWSAANLGVEFRYGTTVTGLDVDGGRVRAIATSAGAIGCDAAVLSMGPESGVFAKALGIDLPVYPVKGYTATAKVTDPSKGPTMGGIDEARYVGYSRLGDRVRIAGSAEFAGFDRSHRPQNFARLFRTIDELFPGAVDPATAECWSGLRPMMPNSVPIIGRARYANLYLDTGHGHLGWTLACGSGKFLADIVAGRKPGIDPHGLATASPR